MLLYLLKGSCHLLCVCNWHPNLTEYSLVRILTDLEKPRKDDTVPAKWHSKPAGYSIICNLTKIILCENTVGGMCGCFVFGFVLDCCFFFLISLYHDNKTKQRKGLGQSILVQYLQKDWYGHSNKGVNSCLYNTKDPLAYFLVFFCTE